MRAGASHGVVIDRPADRHTARRGLLLVAAGILAGCASVPDRFAPPDPIDPAQVSHRLFAEILHDHVHDGRVDYPALQTDGRVTAYLAQLDRVDPLALPSEPDRLAFWINAYNAFAIQGILDGYRPAPYLPWYRFFKTRAYRVGGTRLNLSDLEHEILRKQFREPRIHFAIVCASLSCPTLQPWAYEGARLDQQLDEVTRAFINDPQKNRFDRDRKIAYLSKIFDWFEEDFAAQAGSVPAFVARYVSSAELAGGLAAGEYRIEYLDYDWSVNGPAPKETTHAGAP